MGVRQSTVKGISHPFHQSTKSEPRAPSEHEVVKGQNSRQMGAHPKNQSTDSQTLNTQVAESTPQCLNHSVPRSMDSPADTITLSPGVYTSQCHCHCIPETHTITITVLGTHTATLLSLSRKYTVTLSQSLSQRHTITLSQSLSWEHSDCVTVTTSYSHSVTITAS